MDRLPAKLLAAVFAALMSGFAVAAGDPIVIKFSHEMGPQSIKGRAALAFKDAAEARTRGRVRIEIYPNDTLYGDKNELEALQLGAVHMIAPTLSNFRSLGLREFEVFDLPYLFESYADLHRVTDGPIGAAMLQRLEEKGIHGLAYWDVGFKQIIANRPLRKPADFAGMKMRIKTSTVIEAQMRALGGVPVVLPYTEAVRAMTAGVVDGMEGPLSSFTAQRMDQEQRFLTLSAHGYVGYAVVVNRRFWERLPADIRGDLESAMREVTRRHNALAEDRDAAAIAAVRNDRRATVIELSAEEREAWKRAVKPVYEGADPALRELARSIRPEPRGVGLLNSFSRTP